LSAFSCARTSCVHLLIMWPAWCCTNHLQEPVCPVRFMYCSRVWYLLAFLLPCIDVVRHRNETWPAGAHNSRARSAIRNTNSVNGCGIKRMCKRKQEIAEWQQRLETVFRGSSGLVGERVHPFSDAIGMGFPQPGDLHPLARTAQHVQPILAEPMRLALHLEPAVGLAHPDVMPAALMNRLHDRRAQVIGVEQHGHFQIFGEVGLSRSTVCSVAIAMAITSPQK